MPRGTCLLLTVAIALSQQTAASPRMERDGFGRHVCGLPDVNADGTDDLVVADVSFQDGRGSVWTISGKDGSRIAQALGEEKSYLGGSFFVGTDENGDRIPEVCSLAAGQAGHEILVLSGKTLERLRVIELAPLPEGTFMWMEAVGDLDADGFPDAACCVVPTGTESSYIDLVSTKAGNVLHRIEVSFSRTHAGGMVAGLPDLDGDRVPDLAIATGYAQDPVSRFQAAIYSGKSGSKLYALEGSTGKAGFGRAIGSFADQDEDGVPEVVLVDDAAAQVRLYSGKTGTFLRQLEGTWGVLGSAERGEVATIGDLDGDGVADHGVTVDAFTSGRVFLYSAKGAKLLRTHEKPGPAEARFACAIAALGDLDSDGVRDYAIGSSAAAGGSGKGDVQTYSGASGRRLFTVREADLVAK